MSAASRRPEMVLIAGPTASGKSALALKLASELGGVVVNADAMQVYRDLRILTARPAPEEEAQAPHRLYGVVGAGEAWSVGHWVEAAALEVAAAHRAGSPAILVGGTGLYFDGFLHGLSPIPPVSAHIRARFRDVSAPFSTADLHKLLVRRDPVMAARTRPSDRQRIVRALEVLEETGQSLAVWQAADGAPSPGADTAMRIVLAPPRGPLVDRINDRTASMISSGAVEEVARFLSLGLDPQCPAMKAIGVRELASVIAGEMSLEAAREAMGTATRRYAKRQMTWARGRMADWRFVATVEDGMAAVAEQIRPRSECVTGAS